MNVLHNRLGEVVVLPSEPVVLRDTLRRKYIVRVGPIESFDLWDFIANYRQYGLTTTPELNSQFTRSFLHKGTHERDLPRLDFGIYDCIQPTNDADMLQALDGFDLRSNSLAYLLSILSLQASKQRIQSIIEQKDEDPLAVGQYQQNVSYIFRGDSLEVADFVWKDPQESWSFWAQDMNRHKWIRPGARCIAPLIKSETAPSD